jgi:hypothetical protein
MKSLISELVKIADLICISDIEGHAPAYPFIDYRGKRFLFRSELNADDHQDVLRLLETVGMEYHLGAPRLIVSDALDVAAVRIAEVIRYDDSPKMVEVLINGLPQAVEMIDGYGALEIAADGSMSGDVIRIVLGEQEVMIHVL